MLIRSAIRSHTAEPCSLARTATTGARSGTNRSRTDAIRSRSGGALIAAVLVVTVVATLGACLLQMSSVTTRRQIQGIDNKRAFYLAESGLSEALYGLRIGRSGNIGTADLPAAFGEGLFWVEAEELDENSVRLTSIGLCGSGRFSLSLVVEKGTQAVAALGIFGDEDLIVEPGALIDSYDPRLTTPPPAPAPKAGKAPAPAPAPTELADGTGKARVGCNGDIYVDGAVGKPTRIEGDVTPGTQGTVYIGTGVTITGSTAPRSEPIALPPIEVPKLESKGDLEHAKSTPLVVAGGELGYDTVHVETGAQLVLQGPLTLVAKVFLVEGGAELEIDTTDGPVRVFITDGLLLAAGSVLSSVCAAPERASIYVSGTETRDRDGDGTPEPPVVIACTGRLDGTIYSPHAAVSFPQGFELFGAVSAKSLTLQTGAMLHFDQALLTSVASPLGAPKLLTWRVVELPDSPLVSLRTDPVVALGLRGVTLPKPSKAHADMQMDIDYVDSNGVQINWQGVESDFDWSTVQTVIELDRN